MSRLFKRQAQQQTSSAFNPSETQSSSPTAASSSTSTLDQAAPTGPGKSEDAPRGSAFLNKFRDIKARWQDVMNVDDALEQELADASLHPEIQWTASLRRSNDLCAGEASLVSHRRRRAVAQLRAFLEIPEDEEINELDVPIVALGGSGGGFRAMLGFLATMEAAKELGMWDLIMYLGGVSGSCWALGSYYTWAEFDIDRALNHFATHSLHHPLSPAGLREVMKSPRGPYFLLAPLAQKRLAGLSQTILDLYGSCVTSYLFLPTKEEAATIWKDRLPSLHREWFSWSSVAPKISQGEEPLPLLTAIRHERPWKAWKDKDSAFGKEDHDDAEHRSAKDAWWQWYEFSPFEFGCDELKYWIPIWAFGRPFDGGRSTKNLPEASLSSILGLCTSAPAAPLSIYLGTIQRALPKGWIEGSIDKVSGSIARLWGAQGTKIFQGRHPVHAANEHNPLYHASASSPSPRSPGIENARRIHMLDSGISNNSPTYVFLHPSRGVDVILNFDASSDVLTSAAPARNQEMGDQKGLTFTKRAHPFPIQYEYSKKVPKSPDETASSLTHHSQDLAHPSVREQGIEGLPPLSSGSASIPCVQEEDPNSRHSQTKGPNAAVQEFEKSRAEDVKRKAKAKAKGWTAESIEEEFSGRYVQIFDGVPTKSVLDSTSDHNVPQVKRPVTLLYVPLFPHASNPGYDPTGDSFSGSYNLCWSSEQVSTIRRTAKANLHEGLEVIRLAIREAYERRKEERLSRERAVAARAE